MTTLTEAAVEQTALDWSFSLGWGMAHGPEIAPDTPNAERTVYGQVALERRLRNVLLPQWVSRKEMIDGVSGWTST